MWRSRSIVMLGTALTTQGGVSAVVNVWKAEGLFEREEIVYLATHCDGGALKKFGVAVLALWRFVCLLLTSKPRVVHIHLASRASFWRKSVFTLVSRLFEVPYLIHLHGGEFHLFFSQSRVPGARRFITSVFNNAAAVIVLSRRWHEWVMGVSRQRHVHVLYNTVVLPTAVERPEQHCGPLLSLGRLGVGKGTYDLVEATVRLVRAHPGLQLQVRLAGDGDLEGVGARAEELGVSEQVCLLGWVNGEVKMRELARAGIYVLPSYNEGLPMSVLEAMAAGLPVVATPVGGIPEAVTDGVEGFLVPPGDVDALAQRLSVLLTDDELRRRMGAAARHTVAVRFSSAVVMPQLSAIYANVAGV